jgi:integrase
MKLNFSSALGPIIDRYVTHKQSLGFDFSTPTRILARLDRFLGDPNNGFSDLSSEAFRKWSKSFGEIRSGTIRAMVQVVRDLCLYRRHFEPDCFVPDLTFLPRRQQPISPYIFSVRDIQRLLDQSDHLTRNSLSPLRPEVIRLVIVLLFTTGLRHGELLRLLIGDYDPTEGTLHIRDTKFHKSRLLPLPKSVMREIDTYLNACRRHQLPVTPDTPLIWSSHRGGRAYASIALNVRLLLKAVKIQKPDGQTPRVHDFRHSFAVNVLLRWYRSGVDVQAKLPFLATYMGHVNICSTYYYLHFIEPLAASASRRFERHYAGLLSSPATPKGGSQ